MSVRIANSRGVPGTLGSFARTVHQQRPVFLTSCHVLFAAGAARHDPVWRVHESAGSRNYRRIGSALRGKRGIVRFRGDDYFVDCGIGALDEIDELDVPIDSAALASHTPAAPKRGDRVTKNGAATGATTGIIVDTSYSTTTDGDSDVDSHVHHLAPRQILIRSADPRRRFADEGDSGALIFGEDHAPIGLIWGTTTTAESVACPIGTVLHALNIRLCGAAA
ncbi:MAG TPA: hypothetical protein VI485_29830 [Vicinamibacterales bacterium]|nr:hypothetical protein [Vicinamibacterales bacterium]